MVDEAGAVKPKLLRDPKTGRVCVAIAVFGEDGEVAKHVSFGTPDITGMTEAEYIDRFLRPAFLALERATGERLLPSKEPAAAGVQA